MNKIAVFIFLFLAMGSNLVLATPAERIEAWNSFQNGHIQELRRNFLELGKDWQDKALDLNCFLWTSFPLMGDPAKEIVSFKTKVNLERGEEIDPKSLWGKKIYSTNISLQFNSEENPELNTNPLSLFLYPIQTNLKTLGYQLAGPIITPLYRIDLRDDRNVLFHLSDGGGTKLFEGTPFETNWKHWSGDEIHTTASKVEVAIYNDSPIFFIETMGLYTQPASKTIYYPKERRAFSRTYYCQP